MLAAVLAGVALLGAVQHTPIVLRTRLPVWDVAIVDVDGDGKKDIVALCADPESNPIEKSLVVFMSGDDTLYPARLVAELLLEPASGTAFIAETDGASPKEIIVADQAHAVVFQVDGTRFRRIGETVFNSLLPTGSTEPLFLRDAATDLDGDGIDEWVIPVPAGFEIRSAKGLIARLSADIESETREYGVRVIQHRLPAVFPFDAAGQTQKGLAFLSDRVADFWYGPNWTRHYRYRIPNRLGERWEAFARMDDINGDGVPDIVVTQTEGTINLKVRTQVYVAIEPFKYPKSPNAQFATKGSFTTPALRDVDGDEQLDLVLLSVPVGLRNIVNYFLRKKMTVQIDAHLFENGRFAVEPSFRAHITMEAPEGRERVAYAMGDFTGDGQLDAAVGVGKSKLSIFAGDAKTFLSTRPWKTINMPIFGVALSEDLDGNGTDDLVVFHPSGDDDKRIDIVLF